MSSLKLTVFLNWAACMLVPDSSLSVDRSQTLFSAWAAPLYFTVKGNRARLPRLISKLAAQTITPRLAL
jgi:hypothetical protein